MTTTKAQATGPLAEGETLAYPTPDGRFVVAVQNTGHSFTVTVENNSGFAIAELSRTYATESDARDLAREVSKRLKDGATVAEVVAAIQPAAELISAATTLLELAAAVDALTQPQQRAIRAADGAGHIDRRNVGTVKTLYALAAANLGVLTHRGYRITGIDLNTRGLAMRDHLHTHTVAIAA